MPKKIKVAFQGDEGAYSHLACLEIFPDAAVKPCSTFEEAFNLAKKNSDYKIVIPITNSSTGAVADMHYLIPKYKLQIHAEHFQKVSHNLLGIRGSKITDINLPDPPEISYRYKPIKVTEKSVKKQILDRSNKNNLSESIDDILIPLKQIQSQFPYVSNQLHRLDKLLHKHHIQYIYFQ